MQETQPPANLDQDAFRRVWQRVMPEDRADCPFTVDAPNLPTPATPPQPVTQTANLPPFMAPATTPPGPPPRPMSLAPPVCLGEQSAGELPQLEELLAATAEGLQIYRSLARRWPREPLLAQLATEKLRQVRRLSAAHFLIAGKEHPLPAGQLPRFDSLPLALRSRHRAEQESALALLLASNSSSDPCLIELYRELGLECQNLAKRIRARLERA